MGTDIKSLSTELTTFPLLPLRDVVVFPHMVIPLFVGRPKSIKALDMAMEAGKHILVEKPLARNPDEGRQIARELLCIAIKAEGQRHGQGSGGGHASRTHPAHRRQRRISVRRCGGSRGSGDRRARDRSDAARVAVAVRPVREAQQEDSTGDPHVDVGNRRWRPPCRCNRRPLAAQTRAKAGNPRDAGRRQATRASAWFA